METHDGSTWSPDHPDRVAVTQETAARMLEVSAPTIRKWIADGLLVPVSIGGVKRLRVSDLRRLAGEIPQDSAL